jgi:AcrR family transcriptional regulator
LSQQLNDDLNQPADGTPELRVNPIQRRAKDQLERILSSAAEIADEVGADYLTTAAVATRSGCSIGTVYRMFPDKHHLSRHVASRNIDAVLADLDNLPTGPAAGTSSASATVKVLLKNSKTTPGYRALRLGGSLRGMDRNGYLEVAKVIIATTPESSADPAVVEAAIRGVDGILTAGLDEKVMTVIAVSLLERTLVSEL